MTKSWPVWHLRFLKNMKYNIEVKMILLILEAALNSSLNKDKKHPRFWVLS